MIRKFKFEEEIYESLNCLSMAARRKLDALGVKLSLAQWERLGRGERLMICHAPSDVARQVTPPLRDHVHPEQEEGWRCLKGRCDVAWPASITHCNAAKG